MRAPISVVIPTLNAQAELPACLGALGEGLAAGLIRDVVVSDGGSFDETQSIAQAAGCEFVLSPPGRGGQLKVGVAQSRGPWILILHADTWLDAGWAAPVRDHIATNPKAAVFQLQFRANGWAPRVVASWANIRSRIFGLPYGDQGLLISRNFYDSIGGYQDIPLMEDVAIAKSMRRQFRLLPHIATTSADKYLSDGWLKRSVSNARIFIRYVFGADPADLAKGYAKRR